MKRFGPVIALIGIIVCALALRINAVADAPPINHGHLTFSSASSPSVSIQTEGQSSCYFAAVGTPGAVDATISTDGSHTTAAYILSVPGGAQQAQPFSPVSGTTYQLSPVGTQYITLSPDATWTGSAVIWWWCSASAGLGSAATVSVTGQVTLNPNSVPSPIPTMQPMVSPSPEPSSTPFPYFLPVKALIEFYDTAWEQVSTTKPLPMTEYLLGSSGVLRQNKTADTKLLSSNITSATTTQILACTLSCVIAEAKSLSTGTNTTNGVQLEVSPNSGCSSANVLVNDVPIAPGAANNGAVELYGSASGGTGAVTPAAQLFPVPAGWFVCALTTGTTTALKIGLFYGS